MKEREIQDKHELGVLNSFVDYSNDLGKKVEIRDRPDPPDAVITIDNIPNWIEITDAFFNKELAISMTSQISENKPHRPIPKKKRIAISPNVQMQNVISERIKDKFTKSSMMKIYKDKGSGILIIGVVFPFGEVEQLVKVMKADIEILIQDHDDIFSEIYFYSPWKEREKYIWKVI